MIKHVLTVLLALCWTGGAVAQSPKILELRVSTDKLRYAAYEPVVVTGTIQNVSDKDVEIPVSAALGPGKIRFEIAGEDRAYAPYATGPEALGYDTSRRLSPGDAISRELTVLTSSLGKFAAGNPGVHPGAVPFPLASPGKHYLRASMVLPGSGELAYSNVAEVVVSADAKDDVLRYFPSVEDYAAAVGADYARPLSRETVDRWESFVRDHPKSVFAPFVANHLGEVLLQGAGDDRPDAGRAERMFSLAAERGPRSLLDDALLGLAKSQIEGNRLDGARNTLDRLLKLPPSSDVADEARRLRDGLAKGYRSLREIYGR